MLKLTKTKLAIIIVFILTNLILVAFYISNSNSSRTLRAEIMQKIEATLSSHSITITADTFPVLPPYLPLYLAHNELADKTSIAEKILGSENFMLEPNHFQNKTADLTVDGGRLDLLPQKIENENLLGRPQNWFAKSKAKKALKSANLWTKKSAFWLTDNDKNTNQLVLTVSDKLGKYYVLDSYAKIWVGTEETKDIADKTFVTRIAGFNWLNTTYKKIPNSETILKPLDEILTNYASTHDKNVPIIITAIDFGYIVGERIPDSVEKRTDIGIKLTTNDGVLFLSAIK